MAKPLPPKDDEPWYRQFWPWFLILLPTSMVVAGLYTLIIAIRHADDLVEDDYYRDGLAINRQLEKTKRAEQLGITTRLRIFDKTVSVSITGPVEASTLSLLLSHPMESDRDFRVTLKRVAPGHYRGVLLRAVTPHWYWTLESPEADGWRLDGSVRTADISRSDGH